MLGRSIQVDILPVLSLSLLLGCAAAEAKDARVNFAGASTVTSDGGAGAGSGSADNGANATHPAAPNPDAFWADDPPPMVCGPNNDRTPKPPGGTPECPDDKNREGCPCDSVGETAPCWPGQRKHRGHGQCHDGMTTCASGGEFYSFWGPCEGYQLPTQGAKTGPAACTCFSSGRWLLENLSPCTIFNDQREVVGMVSTKLDASCPVIGAGAPVAHEGPWSANSLQVDCAGQFELCYALKAGDADEPKPDDCLVARVCTQAWYPEADVKMALPALDGWTATDLACARRFNDRGGYGEMTVLGESVECDAIDDGGGQPHAFSRSRYCATDCRDNPDREDCRRCAQGGAGGF